MRKGLLGLGVGSIVIAFAWAPASASPMQRIGSGDATCVLAPKSDCTDVVDKWRVSYHGNLSGAKFVRARLHGADLRGVNLGPAKTLIPLTRAAGSSAPSTNGAPCGQQCQGADLSGANLLGANLSGANLMGANLTGANLTAANLQNTVLTSANLTGATLTSARLGGSNLSEANFTGAIGSPGPVSNAMWFETTCPNGTVTNTGCW